MKKAMITGIFMIFSLGMFAQANTDVLPQNSKDFIKTHFSDATISAVQEDSDWEFWDQDERFEVYLNNGIKLDFNKAGEVTEIDSKNNTPLPEAALPANIVSYVKANYANTQIVSWEKSGKEQEVELSNGLELEFDAQGNFRKID